jgi:hypothetical protein
VPSWLRILSNEHLDGACPVPAPSCPGHIITNIPCPTGWLDAWFNSAQLVGFMAQGFQRLLDDEGGVLPLKAPSSQLLVRSASTAHL